MKSGKCPKCGSQNISRSNAPRTFRWLGYVGHWIFLKYGFWVNKGAFIVHYVCEDCQYLESYIADEKSMQNIHEEWIPLNPQKTKRKNDE